MCDEGQSLNFDQIRLKVAQAFAKMHTPDFSEFCVDDEQVAQAFAVIWDRWKPNIIWKIGFAQLISTLSSSTVELVDANPDDFVFRGKSRSIYLKLVSGRIEKRLILAPDVPAIRFDLE